MQLKETIGREIQELMKLRDELKVKAHLGKKDIQDAWQRIEGHWPEIQEKFKQLDSPAALGDLGKALKETLAEVRTVYRRIDSEAGS